MTKKEIYQRIDVIQKQLTLIHLYYEDFEEELGKSGVQTYIDKCLDELLELYKLKDDE